MRTYWASDGGGVEIYNGDALEVMAGLPGESVGLVLVDPPYFRMCDMWWDRQWGSVGEYWDWIRKLCVEWRRLLKPNGSLYVFMSPTMAAGVEMIIGRYFRVLNQIVWVKGDVLGNGQHMKSDRSTLRRYFPRTERIVFAEQVLDEVAEGSLQGYKQACDEVRACVFEPLRKYLVQEKERAGVSSKQVDEWLGNYMSGHYFGVSQWTLPTRENYERLRELFNARGGVYLRREYEDLRREYEDLRRPFAVIGGLEHTDVWHFETVRTGNGKQHPAEKPLPLIEHMVEVSSRPGDLVLDCFMGSGTTLVAAQRLGRRGVGVEVQEKWCQRAGARLAQLSLFNVGGE